MESSDWVLVFQPVNAPRAVYERYPDSYSAVRRVGILSERDRELGLKTLYSVWHRESIALYGVRLPLIDNRQRLKRPQ